MSLLFGWRRMKMGRCERSILVGLKGWCMLIFWLIRELNRGEVFWMSLV